VEGYLFCVLKKSYANTRVNKRCIYASYSKSYPPRDTALILFNTQELKRYTELIIQATCDEAMKLEGTKLDD
jgi:hypothetical protein